MSNIRFIYNNIADEANIVASTTAGSLAISNVKTERKSEVHRSAGTSVSYTLTWAADKRVNALALPCTNLSNTATIRVRLYNASSTQIFDSSALPACPNTNIGQWTAANANVFPYGGLSKSALWFSQVYTTVRSMVIDLVDTNNAAGYIDCARIIVGEYFEPSLNVDRTGLSTTTTDSTQTVRTDAGDLISNQGFLYDELSFNFGVLPDVDRDRIKQIISKMGTSRNLFVSVIPDQNSSTEQLYMIYGKRANSAITYTFPGLSSHSMQITGW